jgi:hypothetical protein
MGSAKEHLFENQQAEIDRHVADELGISVSDLEEHPYEIEEDASDDGLVYGWAIRWEDGPPPGVETNGDVNFIQQYHFRETPEPERG